MLRDEGIEPILYGFAGASLYLGKFKEIRDIDLLVDGHWLHEDWQAFVGAMKRHGFLLSDEQEHEFVDERGEKLSFAAKEILAREKICDPAENLVRKRVGYIEVTTLSTSDFRTAHRFSSRDGYRQSKREFKDRRVIMLFDRYLASDKP